MIAATVIGLDLDNTLVTYDDLFHTLALEQQWVAPDTPKNKRQIRDRIRQTADGEQRWRALQGLAYGSRMHDAALSPGVPEFMIACRTRGVPVYVVSHRTKHAAVDPSGADLHEAALAWMRDRGFFDPQRLGFQPADVWLESTRSAKIARICRLGCTHFVDDLEEVFREPAFPAGVAKILYAADEAVAVPDAGAARVVRNWQGVGEAVFGRD